MKKRLGIIALLIALVMAFTGCSGGNKPDDGNNNDGNNTDSPAQELASESHLSSKGLHKISVTANANRKFIENGKTDYTIVYADGDHGKRAAEFLVKQAFAASGAYINAIPASEYEKAYESGDKLIVIGVKSLFDAAGLTMPSDEIGVTGYYLTTKDNSAFIGVKHAMGCQSGTLAFLRYTFGYEMYADDAVTFENKGETIPDMEIVEKPDFTFHRDGNGMGVYHPDAMYGLGFQGANWIFASVGENMWHNTFDYLPKKTYQQKHPKWYSDNGAQLCYTAHGDETEYAEMVDTVTAVAIDTLNKYPERNTLTFTIQDGMSGCECAACSAMVSTYGAESAAAIKMTNTVADKVKKHFDDKAAAEGGEPREFTILIFAYNYMEQAPVKTVDDKLVAADDSVKLHDNVGVYIAPLNGTDVDYSRSFYDEKNADTRALIDGWSALTDNIYLWLYETNFAHLAYPFNSWDSLVETYRYAAEINAVHVNNLGAFYGVANPTGFTRLKDYIDAKAMYDVNVNYAELVDKFFDGYFAEAAEPMRRYFDELNVWMRELQENYPDDVKGYCYEQINKEQYWPKRMLEGWLDCIDEAYKSIEKYKGAEQSKYEALQKHILAESIFPRFALLELYSGNYDNEALYSTRVAFKDDIESLGFDWLVEADPFTGLKQYTFSELFKQWGIS